MSGLHLSCGEPTDVGAGRELSDEAIAVIVRLQGVPPGQAGEERWA
jgi:hypothetical protein